MSPEAHLDAAGIASRQFATVRRGFDSGEVRAYLRQLSQTVDELQHQEAELSARLAEVEARAERAERLDESRLVELLGEETARVLSGARTAAADIKQKAQESAARLISEANDEAHRIRAAAEAAVAADRAEMMAEVDALRREAASELDRRRREAEELVAEMRREAEAECQGLRREGEQARRDGASEAEEIRAGAQEEGRRLVAEAQLVRERILQDLSRRRRAAREQLERLHAARDRLLAAYEVVRRTVTEATTELRVAVPEAKIAGDQAMRRVQDEPEPSLAELEGQVAMARIAGLIDPLPDAGAPEATAESESSAQSVDRSGSERPEWSSGTGSLPAAAVGADLGEDDAESEAGGDGESPDEVAPEPGADEPAETMADSAGERPDEAGQPGDGADTGAGSAWVDEAERDVEADVDAGDEWPDEAGEQGDDADAGDEWADEAGEPGDDAGAGDEWADEAGERGDDADGGDDWPDDGAEQNGGTAVTADGAAAPDIDELFARLRSDQQHALPDEIEPEPVDGDTSLAVLTDDDLDGESYEDDAAVDGEVAHLRDLTPSNGIGAEESDVPDEPDLELAGANGDADLLQQRDQALLPIERDLARLLKRALADEQNEVLDLLRRTKPATADELLPTVSAHAARYSDAARDELDAAASCGAVQVVGVELSESDGICDALAAELGQAVVEPLRERIDRSFSETGGELREVTDRIRALYREWKGQRIADAVRHFTAAAYAQGAYSAVPNRTGMRWLVDRGGDPCPDADDNALAGLVCKGEGFPTGDHCPPAHLGCRCLVVPD